MRMKIKTTLLLAMLLVMHETLLADYGSIITNRAPNSPQSSSLEIIEIEQLPYFCGARLNVLVSNVGISYKNLKFIYKINRAGESWSSPQESSTFIFSKEKVNNIGSAEVLFYVGYQDYYGINWIDYASATIEDKQAVIDVSFNHKRPNCEDASGNIEAVINGGWRYLSFDGTTSSIVELPKQFLNNLGAFTMEGDIKLNEDVSRMPHFVGVFGIDNVLEFGFRDGKPSAYISYYSGTENNKRKVSFDQTASSKFPNDKQWHNMVVRSDGTKLEILVDGNVVASDDKSFLYLSPDAAGVYNVTIGAKVWNQSDRGLNGDISRVSFWNRALSDVELRSLRATPPTSSSVGLIASYSLDVRDGNKLHAVVPDGENADDYTGIITNAEWSDKIIYSLDKKVGGVFEENDPISTANKVMISDLSDGEYRFKVTYDAGECQSTNPDYYFTLESTSYLDADISMDSVDNLCEGDDITLKIDEIHGGVEGELPNYQWMKQQEDGTYTNIIGGISDNQIVKVGKGPNIYKVHIETKNGKCKTTITKELKADAYTYVKTKPIIRAM